MPKTRSRDPKSSRTIPIKSILFTMLDSDKRGRWPHPQYTMRTTIENPPNGTLGDAISYIPEQEAEGD